MVVDQQGKFKEDNFAKALNVLGDSVDMINIKKDKKSQSEGNELYKMIKMIVDKQQQPLIVFSFSKKDVESYAMALKKMDLSTDDEKNAIEKLFTSSIACLSEEDQLLPQITQMLPILKNGLGIHHGGLLPIVKEITEILFQKGLLKILFSTETFSMGLNMPAKTVIFTNVKKFDGEKMRYLEGGEYIQMSGRAGRRGLDKLGMTILMINSKMEPEEAKKMLKGKSEPLNSSFYLSYNMLVNSMRSEDSKPTFIIEKSFLQFQSTQQLPEMEKKFNDLQKSLVQLNVKEDFQIGVYMEYISNLEKIDNKIRKIIMIPKYVLPFLNIGRLIKIQFKGVDWGWGVSINFSQKSNKKSDTTIVDVMLHIKARASKEDPVPQDLNKDGDMEVIPLSLDSVHLLSSVKINLPQNLAKMEAKQQVKQTLISVQAQFGDKYPLIDPVAQMKISDDNLDKLIVQQKNEQQLIQNQYNSLTEVFGEGTKQKIEDYRTKISFQQQLNELQSKIDGAKQMVLTDNLENMKRLLRKLNFIDKDDIILDKGKVACEISSCDEVLITEILFNGLFNDLDPKVITATLSALLHEEKSEKENTLQDILNIPYGEVVKIARGVYEKMKESKMEVEEEQFIGKINSQLMEVTYSWCNGSSFKDICGMTNAFEGSIIRTLRRIAELLNDLIKAAKVIGNEPLQNKFEECNKQLKRGIVFAASLYI